MEFEAATVWLKVLHISTLLVWSAGLFYLPGLFIVHTRDMEHHSFRQLRRMTRFAYVGITSPAGVLAVASGTALIFLLDELGGWLALKLTAVALMMLFHVFCGSLVSRLREAPQTYKAYLYMALLPIPTALITVVLWLVLQKPF